MQQPPPRRGSGQQSAAFSFEAKLENEEQLVDAMLASMARGGLPEGVWDKLHAAAQRDDRLSELAFAFESAAQGKRLRTLSPAVAADFLFEAARYFGDVFGDEMGAVGYLERALGLVPGHAPSFAKAESLLTRAGQPKKLAELYAAVAQHRPRAEQAPVLRRAAELFAEAGGSDEKVIELLSHVLRLDPADEPSRARLEALYVKANRLRDVVRLVEQALSSDPPPDDASRKKLLARIVELYADKLHEPERAMPYVEQLLALDPLHDDARRVAQKLVVVKGLAGRAAAALATAYESSGTPQEIARWLGIELENTRGPKRASLLARLGKLKSERMGDDKGAFEAFEQALAIDATDDDLRARYVALADRQRRWLDAARTLGRVLATVKDGAVKAKTSAQLGEVLLRGGDAKRAKATLSGVLTLPDAPPEATLAAAYALRSIAEAEKDARALADVLERIAELEADPEKKRAVDEQLGQTAAQLGDTRRAITAYERLLATASRAKALEALAPLYEASGDPASLARLLEERAKDTSDATAARELMMRAAAVRAEGGKDPAAAIASCRAVVERFGPARDALSLLVPLLDAQRRWAELAQALEQDAAFADGAERASLMARLGMLRMQRLKDADGAIRAFAEALAFDPSEKTARSTLDKLATFGEHRMASARVLEPILRREGASGPLLKILELQGTLSEDADERLAALREAADLALNAGNETARALDLVGRALGDAVAHARPLGEWIERFDRAAGPGTDPKRRAAILGQAIGEHEVTGDELSALARRAAEAYAASGDVPLAIALYRRVLAFEPHSAEVLSRIDDLLRDQGSPRERVALYRAALASGGPARRKELLHRIGAIERHDLDDGPAAIATYRALLDDDPDDADAFAALADLLAKAEAWEELCTLFEARLSRAEGDGARATRAALAEVAATHGDEARARAQCARLLEDPQIAPEHLDAIERAAAALGDADLARAVLHRRAELAHDPREQIGWLEKLGELDEERRGDLEAAAGAWKRAAALAEAAGDDDTARRLLRRARKMAPEDREVVGRLAASCERAELWAELPPLYAALVDGAESDAERVDLWMRAARLLSERLGDSEGAARRAALAFDAAPARADVLEAFERLSVSGGVVEAFERAVDDALARLDPVLDPAARAALMLARARALGADPGRGDDTARAYRVVLTDGRLERGHHAEALAALDALIASSPESPRRRADRRWLLEWRAEHAPEEERVARLLEWARAEETTFADPVHALALHRRVLDLDPESDEALAALARLALDTGDTEAALSALRARRDRADGPARTAIELEIARALLARTNRWTEALASVRAVLAYAPTDADARALAAQLLAHRATRAEAVAMLEQACDATDDVDARAQMLSRLLDAPADADDAEARRGWFERLCDLQRQQGNLEAALATAVRAARAIPTVGPLWDRADDLARALGRPDEVAALYEEVLARALEREDAVRIGERAVQFHQEWFEDSARVVRILERVLELEPTADWAFDRLKLLLDAGERWDDLFALYDRALDSASDEKRVTLLEDAAQTAKDFADRPDRAIGYLEQLHELRPGDAKLASALERLYERQGSHRQLVSLLVERLPSLKRDEARRTRVRIATLWLDELGDPGAALEIVEPLLEHPEEGANGATADSWELLERILAATPPVTEGRRSTVPPAALDAPTKGRRARKSEGPARLPVRQRAADWLRQHYEGTGRPADLVRVLLVELEGVKSAAERVRRHDRIAELQESLGELASSLEQIGLAVALDPGDEARRAKLAALADKTGRLERWADILAVAADAADDRSLRVALTMQAARVRADRIGDTAGASALLSSVLASRGAPGDVVLEAARLLDPLLEATGRVEERLDVLERIARLDEDAGARRDVLGRAARLAMQLGQNARAIAAWQERLASDEGDAEALDGLVEVLEREGDQEGLVQVLAARARVAGAAERRRADRVRMANILGGPLARTDEAIAAWRDVEREFGDADDVALALATLLRSTQRWAELAKLLERSAERTAEDATRAELLRQLGDVQREQLGAPDAAIDTYALALGAEPRHAAARAGLQLLLQDEPFRSRALEALLGALRRCDDWRAILELTAHRLLAAGSDDARLAVLIESADLAERRAGDPGLAFEAIRRAFLLAPADEQVGREMLRLAEASGGWQGLVDAHREVVDRVEAEDVALACRLRACVADVLERRLDDAPGALAEYLRVAADGKDLDAACAAVRLSARLAEWDVAARAVVDLARARVETAGELLGTYEQAAAATAAWDAAVRALAESASDSNLTGPAARDVMSRVAEWHRDRRDDRDAAEAAFTRALAHDEKSATLLGALAELQRRRRGRPLVDTLLRLSEATGGDLALLREAAEVALDSVDDRTLARSILRQVLARTRHRWADAGDDEAAASAVQQASACAEWAIEALVRLHEEDGDAQALVDVLVEGAELPFEPSAARRLRHRAAHAALERLQDHDRAIALYLALFEDDPQDEEAAQRLSSVYERLGRAHDLLRLRQRQVAAAQRPEGRIELRLAAARLHVELGETSRAQDVLRANLGEDPRHEPTVDALIAVLEAEGRLAELSELLADQAEHAEQQAAPARAAALWSRAASVAGARLGDREGAERFHARVVALEPRPASLDALARLATRRGDAATAAQWLTRLLEASEPQGRVEIVLRLVDALVESDQVTTAADRLESSVAEMPDHDVLRTRLATLYRGRGEWEKLARVVRDAAAHASDKPTRMAHLLEAAQLYCERCADAAAAIPLLEQAADLAPEDASVRLELAGTLAQARRFDDARAILQGMIDAFGGRRPKERAPVHYQIARLELAMGNRARALVELDTASRVDPQNPEILRSLAELARDDGQLDRAEKSYRALLVVLRRREDAGDARSIARSEVLLELSVIAGRQGERERAREILESALEAAARTDFEQERLEAALRARGDHETLARVLESRISRLGDATAAARALTELGDVLAEHLGRPEQALAVRLRAIAASPRSTAAHEAALALARSLDAVGRYVDEATSLVDRATVAGDPELAGAMLVRLGAICEGDLRDDDRSAALYERAVALGSRSTEVLRALDRVYERLGRVDEQARILALRIEVEGLDGGPGATSDALYRLADLRLASRDTLDEGIDLLQRALDSDPQLDRAEESLRRAVALAPAHRRLIEVYERVGRQPGRERALFEALKLRSQLPGADLDTVREAIEVSVRAGEPALAESLLERFVEGEQTASQNVANLAWALGALASLREAAGDLRKAVELKKGAARLADPEIARKLEFEVAHIAAERLGDFTLAAETYESLHRSDPADREAWEPLAAVYRRLGEARKLADLLAAVVDYVDDSRERARLRLERVRTMMQSLGLGDEQAAPLLREIVDDDPSQIEAALMLAAILERAGARDELADLLGRQIDAAKDRGDGPSIASLSLRLGALLEQTDRMQARNVYYAALDWEPKSRELLDALLRLIDEGDVAERADLLERRLGLEQGPGAEEMALALAAKRLDAGDEAAAERALELGYRAHPASAALRDRLEQSFREHGRWRKLAELCVLDASARVDASERVARLREAAALMRTELEDPRGAATVLRMARDVAPDDDALLRDHVDMLVEAGEHAAAATELSSALEGSPAQDARRAALLAARAAVRSSTADDAGALEDLEAAFGIDRRAHAAALAAQLQRSIALATEAAPANAARVLRIRLAQVLPYAEDVEGARALLAELVKQDPKDRDALRTLAGLETTLEHWEAASAALRRLVGLEEGPAAVDTALRLADACGRAGRPADARGALERARSMAPQDRAVHDRLQRLYELAGAWHELADLALADARASGEVGERFASLLRAGALLLEQAGDPSAAVQPLEEARTLRPVDPECVGLLADAYLLLGRAPEALAAVEQVIAPHKGKRARELAPVYWRLSRVARASGDAAGEVRALVQALECDAQNGQVCSDVAQRATELDQLDLANRALRAVTLLKTPGPMSKALAYQYMGEIARKQGDPKRALMLLKRALTEDPALEGARALIAAIERGF